LEIERYGSQRCIQNWSFGLSGNTVGLDPKLKAALTELSADRRDGDEEWLQSNDELRRFLAPRETPMLPDAKGEGMVLLAHHDDYGVYFDDPSRRILPDRFLRTYPAGSIALLASCATGNPTNDMAILNRLNSGGIDAMIVSPFKVRLDYGFRLAVEFTKIVRESRKKRLSPTLGEMFAQASAATTDFFKATPRNERLQDMGLEFVLIGDPYLRLCVP
jgi:hypothetical protein